MIFITVIRFTLLYFSQLIKTRLALLSTIKNAISQFCQTLWRKDEGMYHWIFINIALFFCLFLNTYMFVYEKEGTILT